MRLEKSIRNLLTAWIGQFLLILVKFFTRRLFTQYISDDYLGLEGVISNVIGLLGLAELGIATAVGYALYKPLADKDETTIKAIMGLFARIYRKIGLAVFFLGILLLPFLTIIAPEAKDLAYVHVIFFLYIINSSIGYFFSYKSTLAVVSQENYIYLQNHYLFCITMNLVQIAIIRIFHSYFAFVLIQIIFTVLEYICLSKILDRRYPLLTDRKHYPLDAAVEKKIWRDTKQLAVTRIGTQIISSTDSLVISNILGLTAAGLYSNYILIISSVTAIVSQIMVAMSASICNLIVEEGKEKQRDIFWLTMLVNTFFYSITSVCLYNLMQPFISYWLGWNYVLSDGILLAMVAVYYITGIRGHLCPFRYGYGMFSMDAKKSCIEAVLNLVLSVILAWKLGLIGVVLGTVLSALLFGIWMEIWGTVPRLDIRIYQYCGKQMVYTGCTAAVLLLSRWFCRRLSMHWYIQLPGAFAISVVCTCGLFAVVFGHTHEFGELVQIVRNRWKKRSGKNK